MPADNKWYTRLVVAAAIHDAMDSLGLEFPRVSEAAKKQLAAAREKLRQE